MTTANNEPDDGTSSKPAMTPLLKRIGFILVLRSPRRTPRFNRSAR
jgi:hypothetical protein